MSQFAQITDTHTQYTRRARIAQSSALPTVADEPASPQRDVSQGEACPTDSGFIADQNRATIAKSSTMPHDSASQEEAERIKRKGLNLEQESAKKQKTSEEVTDKAKPPEEVTKEKMENDMVLKIYKIANSPRQQGFINEDSDKLI
nr:hypothetical protein [Tanacetum cinerariifolium]